MKLTFEAAVKAYETIGFGGWEEFITGFGFDDSQEAAIYDAIAPEYNRVSKEEFEILANTHYTPETINRLVCLFQTNRNGLKSHDEVADETALIILEN